VYEALRHVLTESDCAWKVFRVQISPMGEFAHCNKSPKKEGAGLSDGRVAGAERQAER